MITGTGATVLEFFDKGLEMRNVEGELVRELRNQQTRYVGADLPLDTSRYPVRELLTAFKEAIAERPGLRLALTGRRSTHDNFSVWNYLDENGLVDSVDFLPYYERCTEFPLKKAECAVWIGRDTPAASLSGGNLLACIDNQKIFSQKIALFVTSFHPAKHEGNSTSIRRWLDHLSAAGYKIHLVYYGLDSASVTPEMRQKLKNEYDFTVEVPVSTRLVGSNYNGLNVHVDDWCGEELLEAISKLTAAFEYDVAVVNYAFMSATFERMAAYTRKILFTHDSFADRNRRMLAQGYPESGWLSIDRLGESLALRRADVVIALQEAEAEEFRKLAGPKSQVRVIGPLPKSPLARAPEPVKKLRIGYIGSSNYVNEYNLAAFLTEWAKNSTLVEHSEIVLAGGVCDSLVRFVSPGLLELVSPRNLGQVKHLHEFFEACDLSINPDRGGTGIKIKTLDAMSHGAPVLCTVAGGVGIDSQSRFHAAADSVALVQLITEIALDRSLLDVVRQESIAAYAAYAERNADAMADLLGPTISSPTIHLHPREKRTIVVPDYVRQTASPYHIEEFDKIFSRVDLHGKRVLEIGSDYHLVSARLFAANGAEHVLSTNLADWRSEEPLPANVSFHVGDMSVLDIPDQSIDIVYGIAVLEHIPDVRCVAQAIHRILRPDGIAYLQGCPIWSGPLGHHVWLSASQLPGTEQTHSAESSGSFYDFADPAKNPIPDWAHLTHTPVELAELLTQKGMLKTHAEAIVNYVYNLDGRSMGSCSNFIPASGLTASFREYFDVRAEPMWHHATDNPYFQRALKDYSRDDLTTVGLRLWLTHLGATNADLTFEAPVVSVIVPFFNVEPYFEECLRSLVEQNLAAIELILVDDASPDGSRAIAERFAAQDPRIRIVTHPANQGLGPARNTGVRHARGKFILFIDSDDRLSGPNALGLMVRAAEMSRCRVVAGSCERLTREGSLIEHDRMHDRNRHGQPNTIVNSEEAFRSCLGLPAQGYIPMRAWGVLIERTYYDALHLDFPMGEHEDMAHVPFLYLKAGGVFYQEEVIVHYRDRAGSLSNNSWPTDKLLRYVDLWRKTKARIVKHEMAPVLGDAALSFVFHLIWRMETNDNACPAEFSTEACQALQELLEDAGNANNRERLYELLECLSRAPWNSLRDFNRYRLFSERLPRALLMEYHCAMLVRYRRGSFIAPSNTAPAPTVLASPEPPTPPRAPWRQRSFTENQALSDKINADYEMHASKHLKCFPSMLTDGDKALYYYAAKNFQFRGSIVDGGCFVGGTTTSLTEGLRHNPMVISQRARTAGLIRVYDLFTIDDDYILHHLRKNYPGHTFQSQGSFQPVFEENMRADAAQLQVRPGDVTRIGYADAEPIEVFGVDFCKALFVTDFAIRVFFPRLLPGALVIQQDFVHEFHPHIHLSMLRLSEYFENFVEIKWGGSVAFTCVKPITRSVVQSHFGADASWYAEVAVNVPLLRRLIDTCHYDENRWVYLLTLAKYYHDNAMHHEAHATFAEAQVRFPQFEPSESIRRLLEGQ